MSTPEHPDRPVVDGAPALSPEELQTGEHEIGDERTRRVVTRLNYLARWQELYQSGRAPAAEDPSADASPLGRDQHDMEILDLRDAIAASDLAEAEKETAYFFFRFPAAFDGEGKSEYTDPPEEMDPDFVRKIAGRLKDSDWGKAWVA